MDRALARSRDLFGAADPSLERGEHRVSLEGSARQRGDPRGAVGRGIHLGPRPTVPGVADLHHRALMEFLSHLALGFGVAFTPLNLLYALVGCLLGTLIGVLPGIGPVATIAMLLPITYGV